MSRACRRNRQPMLFWPHGLRRRRLDHLRFPHRHQRRELPERGRRAASARKKPDLAELALPDLSPSLVADGQSADYRLAEAPRSLPLLRYGLFKPLSLGRIGDRNRIRALVLPRNRGKLASLAVHGGRANRVAGAWSTAVASGCLFPAS